MKATSPPEGRLVAGIDACRVGSSRRGWVAVLLKNGSFHRAELFSHLPDLFSHLDPVGCFAIDMPIGLPRIGRRACDIEAKGFVGKRQASVFLAPMDSAMRCRTQSEALRLSKSNSGRGVSAQEFSLREGFLELEECLADDPGLDSRVIEVHPEVSFRAMWDKSGKIDDPIPRKKAWEGQMVRVAALKAFGIVLPKHLGEAGAAPVDDLLDAAAAAWTADRYLRGVAETFPAELHESNRQVIWR